MKRNKEEETYVGIAVDSEEKLAFVLRALGLPVKVHHCPQCNKDYEPDFPQKKKGAEPYQNEQHILGYCSDKCFDDSMGPRSEYTYDEKGRRFENGVRKPFADPPRGR